MAKQRKKAAGKKKHRVLRFLGITFLLGVLLIITAGLVILSQLGIDQWKDFDPSRLVNVQQTTVLYDKNQDVITTLHGRENRFHIDIEEVPLHVRNAFIGAEDVRFYEHSGVDIRRIVGALWEDIRSGSLKEGASTISQQLIKMSHLTSEKTWTRKAQEAYLAYQMEKEYGKDEILEMYLNIVYFGNGAYGIEAAAQTYFGVGTKDLTLSQAALLAGVIKSPSRYAPHIQYDNAIARRNLVLSQMEKFNLISAEEAAAAKAETITLAEQKPTIYAHGFFVDEVIAEACKRLSIDSETLYSSGYHIETSMDTALQTHCEALFTQSDLFPTLSNGNPAESAIVVLDVNTARVAAIIGGQEYTVKKGLNRATQSRRQPGSSLKPFVVYAPAIERFQYMPLTMVEDRQEDFNGYKPKNFGDSYNGTVTLRTAVAKSLNVPAVRILQEIGVDTGMSYATAAGIPFSSGDGNLAIALGALTNGVTPMELAAAYRTLAKEGLYSEPGYITKITNAEGQVVYSAQLNEHSAIQPATASIMTSLLQSVITDGTGKTIGELGMPIAGKSGTIGGGPSSGNRDAWMAAYNPEYVIVCWMGADDNSAALPDAVTGGTYPARFVKEVFRSLYPDPSKAPAFRLSDSVKEVKLDKKAWDAQHKIQLASSYTPEAYTFTEIFRTSSVPTETSGHWQIPSPPDDLSVTLNQEGKPVIRFTAPSSNTLYSIYRRSQDGTVSIAQRKANFGQSVEVVDQQAAPNTRYEYYVVPTHAELTIDGKPAQGAVSTSKAITTPQEGTWYNPIDGPSPSGGAAPGPSASPSASPSQMINPIS